MNFWFCQSIWKWSTQTKNKIYWKHYKIQKDLSFYFFIWKHVGSSLLALSLYVVCPYDGRCNTSPSQRTSSNWSPSPGKLRAWSVLDLVVQISTWLKIVLLCMFLIRHFMWKQVTEKTTEQYSNLCHLLLLQGAAGWIVADELSRNSCVHPCC